MHGVGFNKLVSWRKWAFLADALVVDLATRTCDSGTLHLHTEVFLHEVDGRQHGEVGVAFAATRAAVLGHLLQCAGGAEVAEPPSVG